jgi:hypothetical protein
MPGSAGFGSWGGGGGVDGSDISTCAIESLTFSPPPFKGSVSRDFFGPFLACMDRSTVGLYKNL